MVNHIFPFLRYFKWLVLRNYWPSIDRIKNIRVPMMIISGTADTLVPPVMLKTLYNEANQSAYKNFVIHTYIYINIIILNLILV